MSGETDATGDNVYLAEEKEFLKLTFQAGVLAEEFTEFAAGHAVFLANGG